MINLEHSQCRFCGAPLTRPDTKYCNHRCAGNDRRTKRLNVQVSWMQAVTRALQKPLDLNSDDIFEEDMFGEKKG